MSEIMVWSLCFTFRLKCEILNNARHDQEHSILRENFSSTNQSSSTERQKAVETRYLL